MNDNDYNEYIILDDDMVDISSKSEQKQGSDHKSRYSKKGKSKKKLILIISSVAAAVVIAGGITGICLYNNGVFDNGFGKQAEADDFKFASNVYVSGISLDGKNMTQSKLLLTLNEKSFIKPVEINVDVNGTNKKLSQSDFVYTFDIDEVLEKAKTDQLSGNGSNVDPSTGHKNYEITASVDKDSIARRSNQFADECYVKATNAYVSKFHPFEENRFEYTEAKQGVKVNADTLAKKLGEALNGSESTYRIVADVQTVDAEITAADIKKNVIKLASYETYSTNTANGTSNMKTALNACSGSIIEPGATWSFNECTGDSNLESNGYKAAHVISDGKLIDGIGGGICQASSTIYNAAVRANMDIEERYCHKWASSYVPTGLDATIDYPRLDLKLSNPTKYQMFMECKVVDTTLYVSIWGYKSDSYDVIKTHNELGSQGGSSYKAYAWRVYIKDGKEVSREELPSSSYDKDYGVVFIDADSDTKDNVGSIDSLTENNKKRDNDNESSSSSSERESSSSSSESSESSSSSETPSSSESQSESSKPESSQSSDISETSRTEED